MNNDESSSSPDDSAEEPFVIGRELAAAHEQEAQWRESGGGGESPLPVAEYDFWRGDLSLIDPRPNRLDDDIRRVCQHYAQADADERLKIRRSSSMDQFYTLIEFANRVAVFGVREGQPAIVADGLTAIAMIELARVDFRDVPYCLGFLYYAADRTGGSAPDMFREAAVLAEPEVAEFLTSFSERAPEDFDLREAWGHAEVQTAQGAGFIGWGMEPYEPTIDLTQTIMDISALIASDRYQPSHVQIATGLPAVWLGAGDNADIHRILSSLRAGASVSADLRPEMHANHNEQQFTAFLVEAASASDAQTLCQIAIADKPTDCCKLAMSCSRLFCLVVARSYVEGVDGYETNESLARFSNGLAEILARHTETEHET